MKIALYTDNLADAPVDLIATAIFEDEPDRGLIFSFLNNILKGMLELACRDEGFLGRDRQSLIFNVQTGVKARRILLIGVGKRKDFTLDRARFYAERAVQLASEKGTRTMTLQLPAIEDQPDPSEILKRVNAIAHGIGLGTSNPIEHISREREPEEIRIAFIADDVRGVRGNELRYAIQQAELKNKALSSALRFQTLANNVGNAEQLTEEIKRFSKELDLQLKVLTGRDLERNQLHFLRRALRPGMHSSTEEARLIHILLKREGKFDSSIEKATEPLLTAWVGSARLSSSESKQSLAAILAALEWAAQNQKNLVLHTLLVLSHYTEREWLIPPHSVFPLRIGKKVNVGSENHDRLLQLDALCYIDEFKPDQIVHLHDKPSASEFLGPDVGALFVNRKDVRLTQISERYCRLPLVQSYSRFLSTEGADLYNPPSNICSSMMMTPLFLNHLFESNRTARIHSMRAKEGRESLVAELDLLMGSVGG